eukprot:282354-Pelagomonas_calceolata.AAC.3
MQTCAHSCDRALHMHYTYTYATYTWTCACKAWARVRCPYRQTDTHVHALHLQGMGRGATPAGPLQAHNPANANGASRPPSSHQMLWGKGPVLGVGAQGNGVGGPSQQQEARQAWMPPTGAFSRSRDCGRVCKEQWGWNGWSSLWAGLDAPRRCVFQEQRLRQSVLFKIVAHDEAACFAIF